MAGVVAVSLVQKGGTFHFVWHRVSCCHHSSFRGQL